MRRFNMDIEEFERDFHAFVILRENPGITWEEALRRATEEDREIQADSD
jgi:hypothetical protein